MEIVCSGGEIYIVSNCRDFWGNFDTNVVVTFHFQAVLVIWQDTSSFFAYYHEGVWIDCKAVGADGHESLYPWFPQQDTVLFSEPINITSTDGISGLWLICERTTETIGLYQINIF